MNMLMMNNQNSVSGISLGGGGTAEVMQSMLLHDASKNAIELNQLRNSSNNFQI